MFTDKLKLVRRNKLFWWQPKDGPCNVGDELSREVVNQMLGLKSAELMSVKNTKRMLAIGSVMHFAKTGDCIWGTGVNGKKSASDHIFQDLDVRAVRGPLTRGALSKKGISVPEVYGDPAILTPLFYDQDLLIDRADFRKGKPAVIPHMRDEAELSKLSQEVEVISVRQKPADFIRQILLSEFVISSSLHGVVLAEAYGVPAVLVLPKSDETQFKYDDYYQGTGRDGAVPVESFEAALSSELTTPPNFYNLQRGLIESFPYDIFKIK